MVRRVIHRTQFQILLGEHFALSGSGSLTPAEDAAKYPTLSAQGKHNWILRVHQELSQLEATPCETISSPGRTQSTSSEGDQAGAYMEIPRPPPNAALQWSDILTDLPGFQGPGNVIVPTASETNVTSLSSGIQPAFNNEMLSTNFSMDYLLNWGAANSAVDEQTPFQQFESDLQTSEWSADRLGDFSWLPNDQ